MVERQKLLTEVELEMMDVIWDLGECTVRQVCDLLHDDRQLAYTSVATIIKILEKKGVLTSRKENRAHLFAPLMTRQEYEKRSVDHLVKKVFRGAPASLVARLIDDTEISDDEIQLLRDRLNERLEK